MKILVTSDWHIHNFSDFSVNDSRMENIFSAIRDMFIYADNNSISTILFCGDLVERQNTTPIKVTLEILKFFRTMFRTYPDITIIGISGNHDLGEKSVLSNCSNLVSWVKIMGGDFPNNFRCIDNDNYFRNNTNYFGIPYLEYKEDYDKALQAKYEEAKLSSGATKILMIHQTPDLPGMNIPMDTDPNDPRYSIFTHVFCGHIHKRMSLTENFDLIGTPLQHSFDEGGLQVENGFIEYDLSTKEKKYINLDYPKFVEIKEGQNRPDNCYVRILPTFTATTTIDAVQREKFAQSTNREDIVKSYFEVDGDGDKETLSIGLKIIQEIT